MVCRSSAGLWTCCIRLWAENMTDIEGKGWKCREVILGDSDEVMEGQSDGLQQGRRSHVTASLQRAALCFVVGHVCCTLSHCLQYRQRRRPHTRPNHSPLCGNSFVCVCLATSTQKEKSPLIMEWWFYNNDLTVWFVERGFMMTFKCSVWID